MILHLVTLNVVTVLGKNVVVQIVRVGARLLQFNVDVRLGGVRLPGDDVQGWNKSGSSTTKPTWLSAHDAQTPPRALAVYLQNVDVICFAVIIN